AGGPVERPADRVRQRPAAVERRGPSRGSHPTRGCRGDVLTVRLRAVRLTDFEPGARSMRTMIPEKPGFLWGLGLALALAVCTAPGAGAQPANDECANATVITVLDLPFTQVLDASGATTSPGDVVSCAGASGFV